MCCVDVPDNLTGEKQYYPTLGLPVDNLSVNQIVDHLYQGEDGKPLVTVEVYQEIGKAKSTKEANNIFLLHLLTTGTVESLCLFGKGLQRTTDDYPIHEN